MNGGYVMDEYLMRRLTSRPGLRYIVAGTGLLAREMQTKIRLLGLDAPFLVGGFDDPEKGVWHYKRLLELENPLDYLFIMCIDTDEFDIFADVCSVVYKILGASSFNHPNIISFSMYKTLDAHAGEYLTDTHVQGGHVRNGKFYTAFGDSNDESALKIHLAGTCTISGMYNHAVRTIPEILGDELKKAGVNSAVYSWGQPILNSYDSMVLLLRDILLHKPDHVIFFMNLTDYEPVKAIRKNLLPVKDIFDPKPNVQRIRDIYPGKKNNGIEHNIDYPDLCAAQDRIFTALSKMFGFEFWNIIHPTAATMREEQSRRLLGLSQGYLARRRAYKDSIASRINPLRLKDYTNIFDDVPDVNELFTDRKHYTEKANKLLAEKLAEDITRQTHECVCRS